MGYKKKLDKSDLIEYFDNQYGDKNIRISFKGNSVKMEIIN